jgi:uncharacterized membrane protein YoaT (DUF817 family)
MSQKWRLNSAEIKAVVRNALIFLAPVAVVVLELISRNGTWDEIIVAVKVWSLGVALDFFRKLSQGK